MTEPRAAFAARADVDDDGRRAAADAAEQEARVGQLHSVRLAFADQHGLLRAKTFSIAQLPGLLANGCGITGSLLAKDTGNTYAVPLWVPSASATMSALLGAKDMVMIPDPATFKTLPWAAGTGWMLCDLFTVDAEPIALSTRRMCSDAHARLVAAGYRLQAGLEFEFHLYRRSGDGPPTPLHPGWDLLGERLADAVEPALEPIRRGLDALGYPPRSIEVELGPGQVEMTFSPSEGVAVADQAVMVRSAIRQLAHRQGLHATFMSRPGLPNSFPSGWHLHQSLLDAHGANAFAAPSAGRLLSATGEAYVAGLLDHAAASCLLTTPTVTGYKRYRPNSVAPDRIAWSGQHRGAMLRLIGGGGDPSTHVENRVGDPAANPYLYLTSQMLSGLDGIEREAVPPPPTPSPYSPEAGASLPATLGEAIEAFDRSGFYRRALGDEPVDYLVTLARSTWSRFSAAVTDWEHREYFELF